MAEDLGVGLGGGVGEAEGAVARLERGPALAQLAQGDREVDVAVLDAEVLEIGRVQVVGVRPFRRDQIVQPLGLGGGAGEELVGQHRHLGRAGGEALDVVRGVRQRLVGIGRQRLEGGQVGGGDVRHLGDAGHVLVAGQQQVIDRRHRGTPLSVQPSAARVCGMLDGFKRSHGVALAYSQTPTISVFTFDRRIQRHGTGKVSCGASTGCPGSVRGD